ncbi:MAG: trimethylamine methyltransferase family protein, partial [Proteobacteria bacterium]|nr:trimethylamine methyltransferase family protein [Pseudomonadota bacterium]
MSLLTPDDIAQIHEASLEVLRTVGVKVDHPTVFEKLTKAGADGDPDGVTVRLPPDLVARCIASAPRNVRLADRRGGCAEVGADGGTVFWGGNALCIARGKERTEINAADLAELTRVLDALENVHGVVGTSISDYPPQVRDFVGFRILAENSTKHLRPVIFTPDGPLAIIEMAEVLADGVPLSERPIVSFGYSIVSPLHWAEA